MNKLKRIMATMLSAILIAVSVAPVFAVETGIEAESTAEKQTEYKLEEPIEESMYVDVGDKLIPAEEYVRETEPETVETITPTEKPVVPEKKAKYSVGANVSTNSTGADPASYTLRNVYRTSSSSTEQSGTVKYYSYDGDTKKTKYTYKNGDHYSGKFKKIVITDGGVTSTWVVDESSLTNAASDTVSQGTGTLTITRSSTGALPEYYYGTKTGLKGSVTQVWAPWNGYRRNAANTEWVSCMPHEKVTKIVFDSTITSVSNNAFRGFHGSLSNVTFNAATKTIGTYAFSGAAMTSITWNGSKTIKEAAFYNCDSLTSLSFGSNAMTINNPSVDSSTSTGYNVGVFQNCNKLASINFGSATTTIPHSCFRTCAKINSITWGAVTTIGAYAFSNNDGFTTLTLNGSIKTIGTRAFHNCEGSFTRVNFRSTSLKVTGVEAFRDCDTLTMADFGSSITEISNQSFYSDSALKTVCFDGNVLTKIGEEAFMSCAKLCYGKATTKVSDVLYGGKQKISSELDVDSNVFTIPYTVTSIGQGAFRNCYSLRAVAWSNMSSCTITTIKYNTFVNCVGLQYFVVPNSLKTIEGDGPDGLGAFYIGSGGRTAAAENNYKVYSLYLGLNTNSTSHSLENINDNAFGRSDFLTDSSGNKMGVRFYNILSLTDYTQSKVIGDNDIIVFPKLKYLGHKAFFDCYTLTGIMQFEQLITIGGRSFVNTSLTDLFFKWSPARSKQSNMTSSIIGSSNQFVSNNTTKGYSDNYHLPPVGYQSLYTLLNGKTSGETTQGLFDLWMEYFKSIKSANSDFSSWGEFFSENYEYLGGIAEGVQQAIRSTIPSRSFGNNNDTLKTDPLTGKDTISYLRTDVEWINGSQSTARETVHFGYKNQQRVDYIFIVDNSPSMDRATLKTTGTDQADFNDSFSYGTSNASKTANAFSIIYDISKKVLVNNTGNNNTISVISFAGNGKNELKNSAMTLGSEAMTTSNAVYNALFKTSMYKEGVATNYGAGLSAAYKLAAKRKNQSSNKQVVILLTDGSPTYATPDGTPTANSTGFADYQANGNDWAAAIRGDTQINEKLSSQSLTESGHTIYNSSTQKYSVHSYENSYWYYDDDNILRQNKAYESVDGLGVDIYGILIGSNNDSNINMVTLAEKNNKTRTYTSSNMSTLAAAFNQIVDESTAENYTVVIPFDDNFKYKANSKVTVGYQIDSTSGNYAYKTFELTKLTANSEGASAGTETTGKVFYDSQRNAIIWQLSKTLLDYPEYNFVTSTVPLSTSYRVYKLEFDMDYVGGGTVVENTTASWRMIRDEIGPYAAVNDNGCDNGSYAPSYISYNYAGLPTNGNTGSELGGVYAYISPDYVEQENLTDHSIALTAERSGTLMNMADPVYLPLGELNITKTDETGNALTGAEFKIYQDKDGNGKYELMNLETAGTTNYEVNLSGSAKIGYSITNTMKSSSNQYKLTHLGPGTYYLYESKYPVSSNKQYTASSLNSSIMENIVTESNENLSCLKVVIEDIPPNTVVNAKVYINEVYDHSITDGITDVQVYNKPKDGNVKGTKVDPEGNPVAGAVFALYPTSADRTADTNRIGTSVSDSNGLFSFTVSSTGVYYWKEVTVPNGYKSNEKVGSVTVNSLSESSPTNIGNVVNVPLASVKVYVNSSDKINTGWKFQLKGTYQNNGNTYSGYTYNGTSSTDGSYTFTNVPVYATSYNGIRYSYHKMSYTLTETGYNSSAIPDKYFAIEYGSSPYNLAIASSRDVGTLTFNKTSSVYVYNLSIKVVVKNYDGADRTTPLSSSFKLNNETIQTDESGVAQSAGWYGYGSNTLTQTKAQAGYNLLSESTDFTLSANSNLVKRTTGGRYYEYTITVYNSKETDIPVLGDNGNWLHYLIGITALASGGLLVLLIRKTRKKHLDCGGSS